MKVFYIDLFLVTELIIDFFLVSAAAVLAGEPIKRLRFFLSAMLSAAMSLIILLPPLGAVLMAAAKLLAAAITSAVAFGVRPFGRYIKNIGCLAAASAIFGGSVYAFAMAFSRPITVNNLTYYFGGAPLVLLLVITVIYLAVRAGSAWWAGRIPQKGTVALELRGPSGRRRISAFVDTGLRLRDAVSGREIVVIPQSAAAGLLSSDMLAAAADIGDGRAPPPGVRFSLVPCETAAGSGMLVGFPEIEVLAKFKDTYQKTDLMLALTRAEGGFSALVGQEAVKNLRGIL